MRKIVILDAFGANPGDLSWDEIRRMGECVIYDRTSPDELLERSKGAMALLTNKVVIDSDAMDRLPDLKYIGVLATGFNVVDIDAARRHGITVTNIPAYSTDSVAQMIFAHILNIALQVRHHSDEVHKGRWVSSPDFCFWDSPLIELAGKMIGIVGLGQIGSATARVAKAFSMKVAALTSKPQEKIGDIRKMNKEELFSSCDVIVLTCPLAEGTRGIVCRETLSLMKSSAILINTGRGPLVAEQDLADALNDGRIYAAGVDVLSTEPPKVDNPLLSARNCYITPHVAWATLEARTRLLDIAARNLESFLEGHPQNVVNS